MLNMSRVLFCTNVGIKTVVVTKYPMLILRCVQDKWTPLILACRNERLEVVRLLLADSRVNVNIQHKVRIVAHCL